MNLQILKNHSILLLGKTRALSPDEFEKLLGVYDITCKDQMDDSVVLIIEGRMMSPYHQNEQERLYQEGFRFDTIEHLEEALCRSIKPETLMMSLKLSNDQERLQHFIQNPYIKNDFFLKLIGLYRWGGESFFATDENRDVTAALIRRFYKNIERNHNVEYANTGLAHLLKQTEESALIDVIASLEPIQNALKKGSDNATLRILQSIALHKNSSDALIAKMIRYADAALLELIASREPLSITLQEQLMQKSALKPILSCNASLEINFAKTLLEDEAYRDNVLLHVSLDEEIFETYHNSSAVLLAHNESLTPAMMEQLFERKNDEINQALAGNPSLTHAMTQALIALNDTAVMKLLIANPVLSSEQLNDFAHDEALHLFLASNERCDAELLKTLSQSNDSAVLLALAKNPSTPIDLLFQLQLDARFERAVHENPAFGEHIQSENIGWL
jgi:hypothetical protein